MPTTPLDEDVVAAVKKRAAEFATQLRSLASGSTAVPTLEWSVADLAQHVAALPHFWLSQHKAGAVFERPDDFASFSDEARAHITETDPSALADLVEHEFDELVVQLQQTTEPRWLYGVQVTPAKMCGLALNELIMHGRDLAAVSGASVPDYDQAEALAALEGMLVTAPIFVDEAKAAAQPDGIYHVRFRGGKSYTWSKQGDALSISEGKPAKADAHLIADPATFLLSSLGRISQLRAGLSGKMISYGRKPWRFFGLGNIAIDDV